MESKQINKAKQQAQRKSAGAVKSRRKVRTPAYLHRKLQVSKPQDSEEREADAVATEVKRNASNQSEELQSKAIPAASAQNIVARVVARQVEEEEEAQTKLMRQEEEEEAQPKLMRQEEEEELQTKILCQEEEQTEQPQTPTPVEDQQESSSALLEQRIQNSRGNGNPLPDNVLKDMEQQFGKDFSRVVIHNDNEAAELCKELNARAFTFGSDIYFAPGEFSPETERGRELLAHELTHVVQQRRGIQRIYRAIDPADTPSGNSAAQRKLDLLSNLRIPGIKQRHLPLYTQLANSGQLARVRNYTRPSRGSQTTRQSSAWKRDIQPSESDIEAKLQNLDPAVNWPTNRSHPVNFTLPNHSEQQSFTKSRFLRKIVKIPTWDRDGNYVRQYQVDHIVELQTSGAHGTRRSVGNSLENMELLDQPSNSSSGSTIMSGIHGRVNDYLDAIPEDIRPSKNEWLRTHDIIFDQVTVDSGMGQSESNSSWWSRPEIHALDHLDSIRGTPPMTYEGDDRTFVLYSGPGGIQVGRFGHARGAESFQPRRRSARSLAGLIIESIQLTDQAELDHLNSPDVTIGSLAGRWDLPAEWQPENPQVGLVVKGLGPYAGYVIPPPPPNPDFAHTSASTFGELEITSEGFVAEGRIPTPSIPLLSDMEISLNWIGDDIILQAEYRPDNLNLSLPGITIFDGSIALSYGRRQGFGVNGTIYFSVANLGSGNLTAGFTEQRGFSADGSFDFDSDLFDEASASLRYQNNQFSGDGTLRINDPDKIKGIRSAEINVEFGENEFSARGSVAPNIPGVEQAGLTVAYSEEEGLTIGGNLQLAANPSHSLRIHRCYGQ
jgi:hypothetical protein